MVATILDSELQERLIEERRAAGADRYDEVWNGVYSMAPMANDEHQDFATALGTVFSVCVQWPSLGQVRAGVNISDRKTGWKQNYRCPDVAVFLNETQAELCGAFWYGGPDFVVEIISPGDRTREKLDFYAKVNTRELLIVDRDPWALELYRLTDGELRLVGKSTLDTPDVLESEALPMTFQLQSGKQRPTIDIRHNDGQQNWTI